MRNVKKRYWACVVYPESLPSNWEELLLNTGLQCCISPLHDKDVNADNSPKKPHYHIILCYEGPTTFNNVKTLTDTLNAPIPQPLEQVRGYYRYLTHKDNPEKAQYSELLIKTINGFNIHNFADLTSSEVLAIKIEIQRFIRDNNIIEYSDLMDILLDNDLSNFYEVASNHTYFFDKYISSARNKIKKQ